MKQYRIDYMEDGIEHQYLVLAESRVKAIDIFKAKTGLTEEDIIIVIKVR